jgi:hypothetical protein
MTWIARSLCERQRGEQGIRTPLRLRAVDSTSISGPASTGTDWRVHYAINLDTLDCDWHEITDKHGGEALARTPMCAGDVMLADRNYLSPAGLAAAHAAGASMIVRLRWRHLELHDRAGSPFRALGHCRRMRVGEVRDWPVTAMDDAGRPIAGRVVAIRLSKLLAAQSQRRSERRAARKAQKVNPKTIEAANYVMVFTTLTRETAGAEEILQMYRCRWQIELAFKRLKQLVGLGRLPHRDARAARTWLQSKLVAALLVERFLANARTLSPWGYSNPTAA